MEKFVRVKDIADYLGVSQQTVYFWTHSGIIPHYRLPKAVRFKLSEVDSWMARRKRRGWRANYLPVSEAFVNQ